MNLMKRLFIYSIILLLGYISLYVYSLSKVEVRQLTFDNILEYSPNYFTISGYIEVYNGGFLPVGVDHISYNVMLEDSENSLAEGYIKGRTIPPRGSVKYPIYNKINWVPTAELAARLLQKGDTYALVKGKVYIIDLKITDISVPFEKRINLEAYIRQFIEDKLGDIVAAVTETISNTVGTLGEGIKQVTGNIVKDIAGLFG